MFERILTNWNFIRIFRLIIGIVFVVMAIVTKDWSIAVLGGFFGLQSLLNFGCCGIGGTCTSTQPKEVNSNKEVIYEEVV